MSALLYFFSIIAGKKAGYKVPHSEPQMLKKIIVWYMFHDVGNITFQKIAKTVNRTSGHPFVMAQSGKLRLTDIVFFMEGVI